ncbi:MAG: hypothetical protein LBK66_11685 [Spirochaetaceae bacterium]|jgi:hypothetical protein|nr:hypothetical protein [Spirochaetaceae bacterium]
MKTAKWSRFFRLLGVTAFALVVAVLFMGCGFPILMGAGLVIGGAIGSGANHILGTIIGGLIGGVIAYFIYYSIIGGGGGGYSSDEGANDLFIELNKGGRLPIVDGYIMEPSGNHKLGSITGSGVYSRGRQIGAIKGNAVYGLDGSLICGIENGCLVKR